MGLILSFEHTLKALQYNVTGGKQFRPMQIIMGYKDLVDKSEQTPEKMRKLYMLCWALELVKIIKDFSFYLSNKLITFKAQNYRLEINCVRRPVSKATSLCI